MRIITKGLNERAGLIFELVIHWSLVVLIFLAGTFYGRRLERVCWEKALAEVSQEYERLIILEKIIRAESSGRHQVWGANGEFGICQFKPETFFFLAEKAGLPNPDWQNQAQQIALLNWSIRNGFGNHWSTFEKAKAK